VLLRGREPAGRRTPVVRRQSLLPRHGQRGVRSPTTSKEEAEERDQDPAGSEVLPGTYTVRYSYDDHADVSFFENQAPIQVPSNE